MIAFMKENAIRLGNEFIVAKGNRVEGRMREFGENTDGKTPHFSTWMNGNTSEFFSIS